MITVSLYELGVHRYCYSSQIYVLAIQVLELYTFKLLSSPEYVFWGVIRLPVCYLHKQVWHLLSHPLSPVCLILPTRKNSQSHLLLLPGYNAK